MDDSSGSVLKITPFGVLGELISEEGRPLTVGRSVIDLRGVPAGTYFLRVHSPSEIGAGKAIPFQIDATPPQYGHGAPESDRDIILAGEGDDFLGR